MSNNMKLMKIMMDDVQKTIEDTHSKWITILKSQGVDAGEIAAQMIVIAPKMLQIICEEDENKIDPLEKLSLSLCSDILVDIGKGLTEEDMNSKMGPTDFANMFEAAMLKDIIKDKNNDDENKEDE